MREAIDIAEKGPRTSLRGAKRRGNLPSGMKDDERRWAGHENSVFYGQVRQKHASGHENEPFCGCGVERVTKLCVKRETIKIGTKMKKQMKRTVYEAPVTERFQIELEASLMAASADITNGDNKNAGITDQEINTDFTTDFSADDKTNVWD